MTTAADTTSSHDPGPTPTDADRSFDANTSDPDFHLDVTLDVELDAPDEPEPVEMHRPRRRWHGVTRPLTPAASDTSGPAKPHGASAAVTTTGDAATGDAATGNAATGNAATGDAVQRTALAVRSLTVAVNRFRAAVADALEVSPTDVLALTEVSLHPDLTPGQLADRIAVGIAGTSTVIDRLVRAGYLRRVPSRLDRRTYNLTLSPAGVHAVGWITDATRAAITDAHTELAAHATVHTIHLDADTSAAPADRRDAHARQERADTAPETSTAADHTVMHLNALAAAYYRHAHTLATP